MGSTSSTPAADSATASGKSEHLRVELAAARRSEAFAQQEAEKRGKVARVALAECAELRAAHDSLQMYAAGGAVAAAATAAAVAVVLTRRSNAAVLAEAARSIVDLRVRSESNLARAERFGAEKLGKRLVTVCDNMDNLVASMGSTDSAHGHLMEGAELTRGSLHEALRASGIEQVKPAPGDAFDVAQMEALFTAPDVAANQVTSVVRPGWVLHGERVLRAAQVGVGVEEERSAPGGCADRAAPSPNQAHVPQKKYSEYE